MLSMDEKTAVSLSSDKPDAIIFIPGLGGELLDQSIDGVARRIASELDRNCQDFASKFVVRADSQDETYGFNLGTPRKTAVRSISRVMGKGEQSTPVVDIYAMNYVNVLTHNYVNQSVLRQTLRLFFGILGGAPRVTAAFFKRRKAKNGLEKMHMGFAGLVVAALVAYMGILLVAVVQTVVQLIFPNLQSTTGGTSFWQTIALILAGLGIALPDLKKSISDTAICFISSIDYINRGDRRQVIAGQFADLLEHIAEKNQYGRIHVVAYSFGTVVALDNLFPTGRKPSERVNMVHSLVTIGCPFDLLRLFWPSYFENRYVRPGRPVEWINIYSPMDILGSNFRNDNKQEEAKETVGLANSKKGSPADSKVEPLKPENFCYTEGGVYEKLSWVNWLSFAGFRAHSIYWESEYEAEVSCFRVVVEELYQGTAVLQ